MTNQKLLPDKFTMILMGEREYWVDYLIKRKSFETYNLGRFFWDKHKKWVQPNMTNIRRTFYLNNHSHHVVPGMFWVPFFLFLARQVLFSYQSRVKLVFIVSQFKIFAKVTSQRQVVSVVGSRESTSNKTNQDNSRCDNNFKYLIV